MRKPAVFLDRDGFLSAPVPGLASAEMVSPLAAQRFSLQRHAGRFVRRLNDRGVLVVVVTDQPALAQGRLSPIGLDRIHHQLEADLALVGARIDGIFHCPHDPADSARSESRVRPEYLSSCRCRKPAPGLLLHAAQLHDVDLPRSFMVCRDLEDVKRGRSAGVETVLVTEASMSEIEASPDLRPHHVVATLTEVMHIIDSAREAMLRS